MEGFRSGRKDIFQGERITEKKSATVSDIKASPEKGKKRVIAREKSARGQCFAMDVPIREARMIERKKTYVFDVEEKPAKSYGGGRAKKTGFRTYNCDSAPMDYSQRDTCPYKSFSGGRMQTSSRTKFI